MAIVYNLDVEIFAFGSRLPRSAEFALMLENINRVEETPATRKRRESYEYFMSVIIDSLYIYGAGTNDRRL